METNVISLRKRILPILTFCQANKGDLSLYETWKDQKDAKKKLFYAYYSGLFCRILFLIEDPSIGRYFVNKCNLLLDKYNWYDIQDEDLKKCHAEGPGCEVPDALDFLDGIDNVIWKKYDFGNRENVVCIREERGSWSFADVRGIIKAE